MTTNDTETTGMEDWQIEALDEHEARQKALEDYEIEKAAAMRAAQPSLPFGYRLISPHDD